MRQASWEDERVFYSPVKFVPQIVETTERERERVSFRNLHYWTWILSKINGANGKFNYFQAKFPWESRVSEMQIPFSFESAISRRRRDGFFIACDFEFYSSLDRLRIVIIIITVIILC